MTLFSIFGVLAGIVNIAAFYTYLNGILKGKIVPHRITFLLYSVLNMLFLINQITNKGGFSIAFPLTGTIFVLLVFILSIKKGIGGSTNFDKIVLAVAIALLVARGLSHEARTTTIIGVLIDFIATAPTIYKVYKMPRSENYLSWNLGSLSAFLSVLAIEKHDYILYLFPLYVVVMNSVVVTIKKFRTDKLNEDLQKNV